MNNLPSTITNNEIAVLTAKLRGKARKLGLQSADCEDLAQDVLLQGIRSYNPSKGASFDTFCWVIFNRRMIDGYRRASHKVKSVDEMLVNKSEPKAKRVNSSEVLKLHLKDFFDAGKLSVKEHNVLLLRAMGFDFYEISSKLDISLGSAHGTYENGLCAISAD